MLVLVNERKAKRIVQSAVVTIWAYKANGMGSTIQIITTVGKRGVFKK